MARRTVRDSNNYAASGRPVSGQPEGESGLSSLGCLSALSALDTRNWAITEQELHFEYERQPVCETKLDSFDASVGMTLSSEVKRSYLEVKYWGKFTKRKVFGTFDGAFTQLQKFDQLTGPDSREVSGGFGLSGHIITTQPYYERHPWNASCLPVDDGTELQCHFRGTTFTPRSVQFNEEVLVGSLNPDNMNYCSVEIFPIDGPYLAANGVDTSGHVSNIVNQIGDMITTANYGGMCAEITPIDGCPEYRTDVHDFT